MFAKIFGKKVIIRTDTRESIGTKYFLNRSAGIILLRIIFFKGIERISYSLADMIVPESEYMIYFYNFQGYKSKLSIGPLYVEDIFFKKNKKLDNREYLVGYVGHFSAIKGVLDFAQSLALLQKGGISINALFVGDGDLRDEVEKVVHDHNIHATFVGWIEKEKISAYLNNIKLLVLPSLREGLPNTVLEAMACSTPVLATSVGGVPDVIKDGETGFILEDNSPECIAKNVMRALNDSNLDIIVKNARELVEREFTYEAAVDRYRKILKELS
jgi:glycosyltransferase involved in cell wall biosynthesis